MKCIALHVPVEIPSGVSFFLWQRALASREESWPSLVVLNNAQQLKWAGLVCFMHAYAHAVFHINLNYKFF